MKGRVKIHVRTGKLKHDVAPDVRPPPQALEMDEAIRWLYLRFNQMPPVREEQQRDN